MAFQGSEYKSEYDNKEPDVTYEFDRPLHSGPQSYLLRDEHSAGPTKVKHD